MSNTTVSTTSQFTTSSLATSNPATSTSSIPHTSSAFTTSSTTSSIVTSSAIASSSTPVVLTTSTSTPTSSVDKITSLVTVSASDGSTSPSTITITSTQAPTGTSSANLATSAATSQSNSAAASTSSHGAALATPGASSNNKSGGLSSGGKIAIAVVVPIVAIAAILILALFFWKRRKARKTAEEERRKEVEEYGYNPNNDPTLPAVGSAYGETQSEMAEDNSGYRGWGATSTQRKPSTTLGSSNRGGVGLAVSSDTASNPGGQQSEGNSGDPLVASPTNERNSAGEPEVTGALGAVPAGVANDRDINRGPSNASSAYTGHARSEGSDEAEHSPHGGFGGNYHDESNYYNDALPSHGPYGDGTYGGGQPVIRDVQARRNTRIEKPSVFPQQGNAGISQNF